jgi:hypothetical protein
MPLPKGISAPATRALTVAGCSHLAQLAGVPAGGLSTDSPDDSEHQAVERGAQAVHQIADDEADGQRDRGGLP